MKIQIEVADLRSVLNALEELNSEKSYWWQEVERDTVKALENAESICKQALAYHTEQHLEMATEQPAQQEIEELTAQRDKLADILTRTANALKGQPAELSLHSWHDLPEVAKQLKAAQQQEPVFKFQMQLKPGWGSQYPTPCVIGDPDLRSLFSKIGDVVTFYTSPPASKPRTDKAKAVIDAARAAMDDSVEAYDSEGSIKISSHLAASLSLCLDEYDRAIEAANAKGDA